MKHQQWKWETGLRWNLRVHLLTLRRHTESIVVHSLGMSQVANLR